MKRPAALATFVLVLALVSCGGGGSSTSSTSNPATGAWAEAFTTTSGQPLGSLTFNMTQNNTSLMGSGMNFGNMNALSQCFGSGTMMSGAMGPGMMNGAMSSGMMSGGTMNMNMSWTPAGSTETNSMVMQGNMAMGMGSGSGTFTLTGQTPGCNSQTGNFTMSRTGTGMMIMMM